MRILFVLKQMGYVRHFDSAIEALAKRGHSVRLAPQDGELTMPPSLAGYPRVSVVACPRKRTDAWQEHATLIRRAGDFMRYLDPEYAQATKLRGRAFEKMFSTLSSGERTPDAGWSEAALGLSETERARLRRLFGFLEDTMPGDAGIEEFLRSEAPDVVLISPLIDLGSGQTDVLKSARALGIPTGMVLFSWDNLSTKGGIHVLPDKVFVWNEQQKREAMELHGVPADCLVVTGAPRFDQFFATSPSTSRAEFCEPLGLDPGRPILAYLESSKFVSGDERQFMAHWIDAIRSSPDPALRGCNLVIKPHPDLNRAWDVDESVAVRWAGMSGVRVALSTPFPPERVAVVRSNFTAARFLYDLLHHSAAVVSLNTSAELEAGILEKPVCTIRVEDEVADGQTGTLHFHYLLRENGGFVQTARDLDEHLGHLSEILAGRFDRAAIRRFITEFLRPQGLDVPAAEVFARAVDDAFEPLVKQRVTRMSTSAADGAIASGPATSITESDPALTDRREASIAGADSAPARVLLDYEAQPIWLYVTSDMERRYRTRTCAKEPWTVAWIEEHVREGDVLYDVGANVGAFSLIAAKRCRNNISVVAFEPGYASFARLCDNIVLNECDSSIVPVPLPLSSVTGLARFKYRTLHPGQSRHTLSDDAPRKAKHKPDPRYQQPILAFRLDDLVAQFKLPTPTHIKLDVDGAELRVLEGACRLLDSSSLRTMLVEVDEELSDQVCGLLAGKGFALTARHQRKPTAPWYGLFQRP